MAGQNLSVSVTSCPAGSRASAGDISGEGYYIDLQIALSDVGREIRVEAVRALGAYDAQRVKFIFSQPDAVHLMAGLVSQGIEDHKAAKLLGGVSYLIAAHINIIQTVSA